MKFMQISPTYYEKTLPGRSIEQNKIIGTQVVIVNSMLNPNTKYPKMLTDLFKNLDKEVNIEIKNVSQVAKKKTIEWYSIQEDKSKAVFIIVGDCATCTYKASQDVHELNKQNVNAYLLTFKEMENLIIKKLSIEYKNKILFIDDELFQNILKKQFDT